MKLHAILIVGLGLIVTGCAEEEQAAPEQPVEAAMPASETTAPWELDDSWRNAEFLEHMHQHAERLDAINFALADGDLAAAKEPATWLSTHDTYADVRTEWLPFLYAMRSDAEAVANATDVATAGAAAQRINAQCQGCHAVAGMSAQ